jgi:hypothetical protein
MHVDVEGADMAVELVVVERLSRMDAAGALVDDSAEDELSALRTERAELDDKLGALLDRYLDGELGDAAYTRAQAKVAERQAALDELIAEQAVAASAPKVLDGMTGAGAETAWADATLARRRAIIDYLCAVRMLGTKATGRRFDPERDVLIEWHAR